MFLAPNPVRRYEHFLLAWPTNTKISVVYKCEDNGGNIPGCGFFSLTNSGKVFTFLSSNFPEIILSCASHS